MKKIAKYVDGFILPVPKRKVAAYTKMAKLACKVWMEHGALDYCECIGDDVPVGKWTSFPRSVKLKKNEVLFYAWATYKSRKHRDQVMKKVMQDPRMNFDIKTVPFDPKRMIWGGFKTVVKA